MTVNILVVGKSDMSHEIVEKKLMTEKYETKVIGFDENTMTIFEEFLPHLIIMDYSDKNSNDLTERMIEFDHTTCIFGVAPEVTPELKSQAFASGVRAIVQSDDLIEGSENIEEIIHTITSACNELQNDKCNKCWENNIFTDLTIKN